MEIFNNLHRKTSTTFAEIQKRSRKQFKIHFYVNRDICVAVAGIFDGENLCIYSEYIMCFIEIKLKNQKG